MATVNQPAPAPEQQEVRMPPAVAEWLREQGIDAADLRPRAEPAAATDRTVDPTAAFHRSALAILQELIAATRRIEHQLSRHAERLRLANRR